MSGIGPSDSRWLRLLRWKRTLSTAGFCPGRDCILRAQVPFQDCRGLARQSVDRKRATPCSDFDSEQVPGARGVSISKTLTCDRRKPGLGGVLWVCYQRGAQVS